MWNDLKDLISNRVRQSGLEPQLQATSVVEWFNHHRAEIVGEELAPYTQAVFVRNKTLTLTCPSAAAMQELRIKESGMVARMQKKFGNEVERIRFTKG